VVKTVILILYAVCAFSGCDFAQKNQKQASAPENMKQQWGIQITAIRLTASGYMLDFRYRVTDPQKALPILRPEARAYILHEKSGIKLPVPDTQFGRLRQKTLKPEANRQYCVVFSTPQGLVSRGDKVSVVIGDFKAEHVTVE